MIKQSVTLDDLVNYLNELINIDKAAIAALINNRVPCNEQLAEHPTVQVLPQNDSHYVGLFGILNGLFGIHEDERGPIAYILEDGDLVGVAKTTDLQLNTTATGNSCQWYPTLTEKP